jgi:NAD(P)H-flavin reductase
MSATPVAATRARSAGEAATLGAQVGSNPWRSRTVTLASIVAETRGVATYHFRFSRAEDALGYDCQPGQFNMLYVPGAGECAISASGRDVGQETWLHTIRAAGNVTRAIERLQVGETLGVRGPFGTAWPLDAARGQDIVLIAGGIGLAPLRPAIERIAASPADYGRVTLVHGARSPESLLFARDYAAWNAAGVRVETTVDRPARGWTGNIGVATLILDRLHPFDAPRATIWMCGPEVMMRYAARSALYRGVPPGRIYVSLERNMQCAVGLCGHCQLGPAFICKDGPVFRYDRVSPFLRVENL